MVIPSGGLLKIKRGSLLLGISALKLPNRVGALSEKKLRMIKN